MSALEAILPDNQPYFACFYLLSPGLGMRKLNYKIYFVSNVAGCMMMSSLLSSSGLQMI